MPAVLWFIFAVHLSETSVYYRTDKIHTYDHVNVSIKHKGNKKRTSAASNVVVETYMNVSDDFSKEESVVHIKEFLGNAIHIIKKHFVR